MRTVCLADESHKMSIYVFEKKKTKKKKKKKESHLLQIFLGT